MSVPFGITAIPTSSTTTGDNNTDNQSSPVSVQFNPSTVETQLFHNEASVAYASNNRWRMALRSMNRQPTEIDEYLIRLNCSQIDANAQFVIYTVTNGLNPSDAQK